MRNVRIFDTTLRDGEQAAGGALTIDEKLEIGRQLARLNVDVIEAGFPFTSPGDFRAVDLLARELRNVEIAGLSGYKREQIDTTWDALKSAACPLLHIVISTSDIHLQHQLRERREVVIDLTRDSVGHARTLTDHIEFSAMDATRSDLDFVSEVFSAAIETGATVVNFPDTVGYAQPAEFADMVQYVMDQTRSIEDVVLSVHCHDDLGQAVANSLVAVKEGAAQVECTINGVGERAGNASLEEIVMALRTRSDYYEADTRLVSTELARSSRLVSNYMGMVVPPNKAVIGANAFAHASGLHQDGMLKERTTYEIMNPSDVGLDESSIVLGKTSGRHAFRDRLKRMGYRLADDEFQAAFQAFKEIADRKKTITDRDLEAIVQNEQRRAFHQTFELLHVQVSTGTGSMPTATVRLRSDDGEELFDAAIGTGPVDAIYRAINRLVKVPNQLTEFSINSVTEGIDAIGEVTIRIESNAKTFSGHGADTDILVASAQAYVNALNRLMAGLGKGWSTTPEATLLADASGVPGNLGGDMGRTLLDKVWDAHTVRELPNGQTQLFIGLHLVHEVTSPQAFQMLAERGLSVRYPDRTFATVDHIIPTDGSARPYVDGMAEQMFMAIERNIDQTGIPFFDRSTGRQGIVHVIGPELGLTQPGMTIACGDSHTSTHGAFGAIAFGIGTSQVRDVLATQTISVAKPQCRRITVRRETRRRRLRQGRDPGHHRPARRAGRRGLCLRVHR